MISEWKKVHNSLASEMRPDSSLGRILLLSYDDLQYNLKLCFLYLSVFPEDYLIKRRKMIRLWVSERFVEEIEGLTADEVAENYLNELVSRSMIEAVQINDFNRIRSCRIHDLMREIIQLKSKEEYFVRVVNEKHVIPSEKIRHLAIHLNSEYFPTNINKSRLRSLLVFTPEDTSVYLQHTK